MGVVAAYSGGSAPDFHGIPSYASTGGSTRTDYGDKALLCGDRASLSPAKERITTQNTNALVG